MEWDWVCYCSQSTAPIPVAEEGALRTHLQGFVSITSPETSLLTRRRLAVIRPSMLLAVHNQCSGLLRLHGGEYHI